MKNRESLREPLAFLLLLALGVIGRWCQPTWHFTPVAAATAVGAFYFTNRLPALLLPIGILTVSDVLLPAHDNALVQLSVYAMMLAPCLLGRAARGCAGRRRAACWGLCGFVPATLFFIVTNFAVWAFKSDYAATAAGLMQSYAAGLPFYRAMLAGDVFYLTVLLGCIALAGQFNANLVNHSSLVPSTASAASKK